MRAGRASVHTEAVRHAKANLASADRRKADLRGIIPSGATLTDANLAGANFFKSVLDAADLAGANLIGAQFLNCAQLRTTRNWQLAFRDLDLACGAPVPIVADPP